MKRGDLVTVAMAGAYGKPRPAVIVQSDAFGDVWSVTFLPLTSDVTEAWTYRVRVEPTAGKWIEPHLSGHGRQMFDPSPL